MILSPVSCVLFFLPPLHTLTAVTRLAAETYFLFTVLFFFQYYLFMQKAAGKCQFVSLEVTALNVSSRLDLNVLKEAGKR